MTNMIRRREFLKVGALGSGITLSQWLRMSAATEADESKTRSAILVFLKGGPSHQDMFDMKPDAPKEYRGEFHPIATNVAGVEICEHLPQLAKLADKYAVIRGISHNLAAHGLGTRYLLTGNRPIPLLRYPEYGSVVSKESPAPAELPSFVSIDESIEGPGYLGTQYGALATGEKPRANRPFNVRGITLDEGLSVSRVKRRRRLASDVDTAFRGFESLDENIKGLDEFSRRAHQIINSPRARDAFDLSQEPPSVVNRFGSDETGQSMLLACRLIEAGVRFVTVLVDGWDTHQNNFAELKTRLLPSFDRGFASLLTALEQRGLLDSTSVMVTGEFGRTPKVNGRTGRDHWAQAMFALLAGGNVRGGQAIGASDDKAAQPAAEAFSPDDLAATFYQSIGINPRTEYHSNIGRPITLVRDGNVISQALQ